MRFLIPIQKENMNLSIQKNNCTTFYFDSIEPVKKSDVENNH